MLEPGQLVLHKYIYGIVQKNKCIPYQIGGVEDHIHIVTSIHPSVALARLVKDIKVSSNLFIKSNNLFPGFIGWQNGYGAFTYSFEAKDNLINYVKNQKAHHSKQTIKQEYKSLLNEHGVSYDEQYLF